MEYVPLKATASQRCTVNLGGQRCEIKVDQKYTGGVFLSLTVNGTPVLASRICRDRVSLVRSNHIPFAGSLVFVDTQGKTDPDYTGFESRYRLAYIP